MRRDEAFLTNTYTDRRARFADRDRIGHRVRDVLANELDVTFRDMVAPEEEPVVANLIWAAARTVSQRVSSGLRIDCRPRKRTNDPKMSQIAEDQEAVLHDWADEMALDITVSQMVYWMVTHDLAPLTVRPKPALGRPIVEVRDPLTTYPGSIHPHSPGVTDCLFVEEHSVWEAEQIWPGVAAVVTGAAEADEQHYTSVTVAEFWDDEGVTIALVEPRTQVLDYLPHVVPGPQVYIARGFSPDLGFHGQFDHSVPALIAQAKLFALMMAYAEQQVGAETVVVGDIVSNAGQWATGPGSVNVLAPMPGAQAGKLNNQMSIQLFSEIDRLERFIRIGGNFPAQLSGEPVSSVATGKGLEQLVTSVDDNVAYWQKLARRQLAGAMESLVRVGVVMGSDGAEALTPDKVRTDVRFLAGVDPAYTVRQLQLLGAKVLARTDLMREMPEIEDVDKALARIDADDLRQALMNSILTQVDQGMMPPEVVAEIIAKRNAGDTLEGALREVLAPPEQEPEAAPGLGELLGMGPGGPPGGPAPAIPLGGGEGPPPALPEGFGVGV